MAGLIGNFQDRVKTSSNMISLMLFKAVTGFFLGLTLALIGDAVIDYGWFSFVLVVVVTIGACMKVMKPWSWMHVFIFDLVMVLIGMLLRMYILIAPG